MAIIGVFKVHLTLLPELSKLADLTSVLLVCYNFPPSTSIGGRRWAYLTRELHNIGIKVFVITSDYNDLERGVCPWLSCIDGFKENIIYLPSKVPYFISHLKPTTLIGKLMYRLTLWKAKFFFKGNVYDASLYFSNLATKVSEKLILQNKIKNVIVTGGPFHLVHKVASLKQKLGENIKLFVDLRDPWTENYSQYDLISIRKLQERKKNTLALYLADRIYLPSKTMIEGVKETIKGVETKMAYLPHGFDLALFDNPKGEVAVRNKWIYAGSVYDGIELEIGLLKSILLQTNASLDIYTYTLNDNYGLKSMPNVSWNKLLPQSELVNRMGSYGVAIILLNDQFRDYFSSKFYELLRLGKFLLYIGPHGRVSEFIEHNKIGYCVYTNSDEANGTFQEEKFWNAMSNHQPRPELAEEYAFDRIVKIIEKDLKQ